MNFYSSFKTQLKHHDCDAFVVLCDAFAHLCDTVCPVLSLPPILDCEFLKGSLFSSDSSMNPQALALCLRKISGEWLIGHHL